LLNRYTKIAVIIQEIIVPKIAYVIMHPKFSKKYYFLIVNADSKIIGGRNTIKNI